MSKDINDSSYWREFEQNELTHSAAHYLMAIDSLREELGYARVTDVADKLEVSRGAASMRMTAWQWPILWSIIFGYCRDFSAISWGCPRMSRQATRARWSI